jgi:RimJ/RimL family protein N-acetyltransferase
MEKIAGWFNDSKLNKYTSHRTEYMTFKKVECYIRTSEISPNLQAWAVLRDDGDHIGNISLQQIDFINRSAEIAWMISEPGKGAGTEAGRQVLDYAFNILNLNRVWCGCVYGNKGMIRVAEKLRFKQEGFSRQAFCLDGEYTDIINFGILKGEWNER